MVGRICGRKAGSQCEENVSLILNLSEQENSSWSKTMGIQSSFTIHLIICTSDVKLDTSHTSIRIVERSCMYVMYLGKPSVFSDGFEKQERSHNGEKTCECKGYGETFSFSLSLQIRARTPTGEKLDPRDQYGSL